MSQTNGNEKVPTPLQLEAIEKETKAFECPNCHIHLQFRLSVKVVGVQESLTAEENAARDGRPLTPKATKDPLAEKANPPMGDKRPGLLRLVEYYRDIGILAAFEQVAADLHSHQLPKDMGGFFLTWMRTSVRANLIPKLALRRLINEFDDGMIEVWHSQLIAAVVSDGRLRCFVPMHLLRGETIRAGGGSKTSLRTSATEERLDNWIRTKHGYVLGGGAMFQEMQKQAKGNFELTVKS